MSPLQELEFREPRKNRNVVLVSAMYREPPLRMHRLLKSCRPWFDKMIVALQDPLNSELAMATEYADIVLQHEASGFCESSYADLLELARDYGEYVFSIDGDELAEPSLLASLDELVSTDMRVRAFGGARILKRTTFGIPFGSEMVVLPGVTEANLRLYRADYVRPAYPHSRIEGPPEDIDPPLIEVGALREHRTVREYVIDQVRYAEKHPDSEATTRELLNRTFRYLCSYLEPAIVMLEYRGASETAYQMVRDAYQSLA